MRTRPPVLVVALLIPLVLAIALGAMALSPSPSSGTVHVEVVQNDLGLVAGLATVEGPGLLGTGIGADRALTADGWVVVTAAGASLPAPDQVQVVDTISFTDPNGAAWDVHELSTPGGPAWATQVQEPHHDPALDGAYNWVTVVDWTQVEGDLTVHYVPALSP